jgi:hypothetical protein
VIKLNELMSIIAALAHVFVIIVRNNLLLYMVCASKKIKMVLYAVMALSNKANNVTITTYYLMMDVRIYVQYSLNIFVVFIQIEMVLLFVIITCNQK